eukprot:1180952-Prorocentrum_minimum.AAC.9
MRQLDIDKPRLSTPKACIISSEKPTERFWNWRERYRSSLVGVLHGAFKSYGCANSIDWVHGQKERVSNGKYGTGFSRQGTPAVSCTLVRRGHPGQCGQGPAARHVLTPADRQLVQVLNKFKTR